MGAKETIKKVFGWFFLFIGCTYLGSLPFSITEGMIKTESSLIIPAAK